MLYKLHIMELARNYERRLPERANVEKAYEYPKD